MGFYINAGNENLRMALNSQIFVDKSLILQKLCSLLNTQQRFICVSRPRRFTGDITLYSPKNYNGYGDISSLLDYPTCDPVE